MKTRLFLPLFVLLALGVRAESPKSYQVTGPVVALTENVITVMKGDEKWEIGRTAATKVDGKLAVGSRVTIYYRMAADSVDVKAGDKSTEKADKAAEKASRKAKQ